MTTEQRSGRGMRPEDIGGLRQAQEVRLAPAGDLVAFTVVDVDLEANRYRRRIWLAPTARPEQARPFSAGPNDYLPSFSPDGRRLAFAASPGDGDGGGAHHICVLPIGEGGERVVVASWPAPAKELAWSPLGDLLAFVARDPDDERYGRQDKARADKDMPARRINRLFARLDSEGFVSDRPMHVAVVPADGSQPPRVATPGEHEASDLSWSPDGSRLAFCSARHDTWDLDGAVDLWTIELTATDAVCLTGTDAVYSKPSWSPDGRTIAYLCVPTPLDEPRHARLGVIDAAGGSQRELATELDRNCSPYGAQRAPVWVGQGLLFAVEDEGNVHLYRVDAETGKDTERVLGGPRWVTSFDWARDVLAFSATTPTTFPEVFVRALAPAVAGAGAPSAHPAPAQQESPERQLSALGAAFISRTTLVEPVPFDARSADGTQVPCWAMPPVGVQPGARYPTLLNVHGGPFTSYGNRFFDEFQMQTGAGFGVLYCNPRGSSGYSEAWGRAIRWPQSEVDPGSGWGGVDFEDVMACVEEACDRFDWIDADRLGILGGSYGGYMTSWAIGHTDRFRAACSERAANNLLTLETSSDLAGAFRAVVGLSHLEHPEAFLERSPIGYLRSMTTPVLILHSENDLRCPIAQAEELFVGLRLLGRQPVLVRFPGESHELSRSGAPTHRVERARIILEWFGAQLDTARAPDDALTGRAPSGG